MTLPTLAEVYARWHNPSCGFELEPDRNIGPPQTSENGILFHAIFLMVLRLRGTPFYQTNFAEDRFHSDVFRLQTAKPGVFDRGAYDSEKIPYNLRNENSHDNYKGICMGLLGSRNNYRSGFIRMEIATHGLKNCFIYNNVKPRICFPMNPGNWSVFLAASETYKNYQLIFLPFFILNFFWSNFIYSKWESVRDWIAEKTGWFPKKGQSTSGKQLYMLMLYTLRKHKHYKWMYNLYVKRMRKLFGEYFVEEIFKIYYTNPEHPIRLYAAGIKLEEQK